MRRDAARGQAAVEWIGTVVAVAMMATVVAMWAAREIAPPERPLDPVMAVAAPLGGVSREMGGPGVDLRLVATRDPRVGLGRQAAGWLGRTSRSALVLGHDMGSAFGVNFASRMRHRVRGLLDEPPGAAELMPDPGSLAPGAVVRDLVRYVGRDPGAIRDYLRTLRAMPPRQAAVRAAGDAGAVVADGVIEAAELLIKRLILRGVTRAGGGGSRTGSP
jgi:pimeloyl-ACP methyl ester carboxylesterase